MKKKNFYMSVVDNETIKKVYNQYSTDYQKPFLDFFLETTTPYYGFILKIANIRGYIERMLIGKDKENQKTNIYSYYSEWDNFCYKDIFSLSFFREKEDLEKIKNIPNFEFSKLGELNNILYKESKHNIWFTIEYDLINGISNTGLKFNMPIMENEKLHKTILKYLIDNPIYEEKLATPNKELEEKIDRSIKTSRLLN